MRNDPEAIIEGVYRAWMARDRDVMLAYFTDDAVIAQHVSPEALPFAGTSVGKARLADRIDMVFRDWEFEKIKLSSFTIEGQQVRSFVDFGFDWTGV